MEKGKTRMTSAVYSRATLLAAAAFGLSDFALAGETVAGTAPVAFAAQHNPESYGHHMWDGGWFFGPVMMVLVIAAIVALVVLIVRWLGASGSGSTPATPEKTPLDVLKHRFARGEIDQKEFEERRRALED